ncbi:helix-turn-helix domain-containing protein [Streptomyces sp. NBC_01518]|uniref:helix-turn-helix domain-containing protein n=1 Tax=Streptomyces sp. NBC_01518 TaxID=2903891 RepID=UPI00387004B9
MLNIQIKRLRTERNLTQRQVANRLNVGEHLVSRWERGVRRPSLDHLVGLAGILDVSVSEILGDVSNV